jgi:hypothetical protein
VPRDGVLSHGRGLPLQALFENGRTHPVLNVRICAVCDDFRASQPITQDAEGNDERCSICHGGIYLMVCEFSTHAFCEVSHSPGMFPHQSGLFCHDAPDLNAVGYTQECVTRNLGADTWAGIAHPNLRWRCFCCDNSPLHAVLAHQAQLVEVPPRRPWPFVVQNILTREGAGRRVTQHGAHHSQLKIVSLSPGKRLHHQRSSRHERSSKFGISKGPKVLHPRTVPLASKPFNQARSHAPFHARFTRSAKKAACFCLPKR